VVFSIPKNQKRAANRRVSQNKVSGRIMEIRQNSFPAQFKSTVILKHKFRYQSAALLTAQPILRSHLLQVLFVNLTSLLVNSSIIAGIKLNRVEMFAVGGNTGALPFTPATTAVEWTSTYGPATEISDTGNAFSPAHLISVPPPQSLASFWSLTNSNVGDTLMLLTLPINTIVDIWVEMVLYDGENTSTVTTSANGTAGQLYAGYLDGPGAATVLQPVSYLSLH